MIGDLFSDELSGRRSKIGHADIEYKGSRSILSPTSGFMKDYDFSLNPYSGCTFGCNYCYAAFFTRNKDKMDNWGRWLQVKENAVHLLQKFRTKPLNGKAIYISSVTDPYQPIEKDLELTRSILKELNEFHSKARIVIQTRSPLVTRDIDLLKRFEFLQVNMTVTTDSEEVRKVFEPYCPANNKRLEAIAAIQKSGIQSCITLTPLLPIEYPNKFSVNLKATGVERFIIQPFHKDKGKFVAGTRKEATEILKKFEWGDKEYKRILAIMQEELPNLGIGQSGFAPI